MKYALVNNVKQEAVYSGETGVCIYCGAKMIAFCGPIMINHWKHNSLKECDDWHEPETEWHREWKNHFPKEFQEVVMLNNENGEKHIADVYNSKINLTIEFQHSFIKHDEITSRESFYKRMLWMVDLIPYKSNIILHKDIKEAFFEKIVMEYAKDHDRKVKQLERQGKLDDAKTLRNSSSEEKYINWFTGKYDSYSDKDDYYLMQWKYQQKRWNTTKVPLFFDLGDEFVYMNIETIKIWNGFLVKRFSKSKFIEKYI